MAYQALYRKYRPSTFDDVVGQEHITSILKNQIATGRTSHAYLFTGTRGTGKTTCAKILARALNCEQPKEGNPCCECFACRGIGSGSILDVVELDAASNNGVDSVRALRDEAIYSPAAVKKRVYIIDEVHMLSTAAFNALLKIMEEPPEHLVFILATTELHKVPATILSRCQRYSFRRIGADDIAKRLNYVAEEEGIELTHGACELIARMSDGALRDALSLLDQCATGGAIDEERVRSAIGLAGSLRTEKLLELILDGDAGSAMRLLDEFLRDGGGETALLDELAVLLRDALITLIAPKNGDSLLSGSHLRDTLANFASRAGGRRLMDMLESVTSALAAMSRTSNRRTEAELCLISACGTAEQFSADESRIMQTTERPKAAVPLLKTNIEAQQPVKAAGFVQEEKPKAAGDMPPFDLDPPPKAAQERPKASEPTQEMRESSAPVVSVPAASKEVTGAPAGDVWKSIVDKFKSLADGPLYFVLNNPMKVSGELEGGTLTVYMKNPFELQMFSTSENSGLLKKAATAALGHAVTVRIIKDERKPVLNEEKLAKLARFSNVTFEN